MYIDNSFLLIYYEFKIGVFSETLCMQREKVVEDKKQPKDNSKRGERE